MDRTSRAALAVFVALAIVLTFFAVQWHGPSPKPADAAPDTFSAARALQVLKTTIGSTPHPIGTEANRAVRDRIVAHLDALGYETHVRHQFACNAYGVCGWTDNILARPPGQPGGPTVILAAHYDSVPAGPGASDDGSGVAALLEVARAVRTEHFRNPITFLIDDGEEAGLLGAEAFLQSPTARFASVVINLEARGTSGPSFLFETSTGNRWFLPIVARALPHPATSSLFYTVYQHLPNDTDLTVFKRAGFTGVNFAFLGDVVYYHTPLDDVAHVNLRTLQDQGDNTLATLRALANTDLRRSSSDDAVWFDVLGLFVMWWPARWTIAIAILSLGTALVAAALLIRDEEATINEIAAGILAFVASIVAAGAAGFALAVISLARSRGPWLAMPGPAIAAAWVGGIMATLAVTGGLRRRCRSGALFAGIALAWNLAAVIIAATLPGISHLLLVPAVALAIASLLRATATDDDVIAEIACAFVAAVLWFPLATSLYSSLGRQLSLMIVSIGIAIVATTFAPLFATRLRTVVSGIVAALLLAIASLLLPPVTASDPEHISITYLADGTSVRYVAGATTPKMNAVAAMQRSSEVLFPWSGGSRPFVAPAPRLDVPPVSVVKTADSAAAKRTLTLHVASARNAPRVALFFRSAATVERIRINGVVPPYSERAASRLASGWHVASIRGGDMDVEITARGHLPIDVVATDTTFGLPAQARSLAAARDASTAVPVQDGDAVVTMRRATF